MRGITVFVAAMLLSVAVFAAISNAYTGQTTRVSVSSAGVPAIGSVSAGVLSANGRYVVFQSSASNLVTGVGGVQIYRHDRMSGTTELVRYAKAGGASAGVNVQPTVSADGRYVAFGSFASDLID